MDTASKYHYRPARENPSFSSSLLDEIYRSIDEPDDQEFYKETSREKQSSFSINGFYQNDREVEPSFRRACLVEKWMEKEVVVRSRSAADFRSSQYLNSSSSSSDSSCGGGFSSSEAESVYGVSSRPKPIRTSMKQPDEYTTRDCQKYQFEDYQSKPKHEGKFVKTKSRVMKIYGNLKKAKQPISPGGRLATFLNSLLTTKNTKLSPSSAGGYEDMNHIDRKSKSANASTCSSASSFSRSCLSKTPSSRGKLRSVRFYPVSVIVDEDCQPCGHKTLYGEESNLQTIKFVKTPITEELKLHSSEKNRRIEEAARNLLRNYQKKVECEFDLIRNSVICNNDIHMSYDDDDAASNASSDLFELENLSAIGIEKYRDELPVYETTHLDISNGFLM